MIPERHRDISSLTEISENNFENLFSVHNDGVYYYNLMKSVYVPEEMDPSMYFLVKMDVSLSLTALSHRIYGNINLWWLICIANGINDSVRPIETGTVLKIIHPSKIPSIVKSLDNR